MNEGVLGDFLTPLRGGLGGEGTKERILVTNKFIYEREKKKKTNSFKGPAQQF